MLWCVVFYVGVGLSASMGSSLSIEVMWSLCGILCGFFRFGVWLWSCEFCLCFLCDVVSLRGCFFVCPGARSFDAVIVVVLCRGFLLLFVFVFGFCVGLF